MTTKAKNSLWDNLKNRTNISDVWHDIATLIQLEHIVFRIINHEGVSKRIVAIYDSGKNELKIEHIKKLVESYTFPILTNTSDNEKIIDYFEIIHPQERKYLIDSHVDPKLRKEIMYKIKAQQDKQLMLRAYYNYPNTTRS